MPSAIRSCECEPIHLIPAIQDIGAMLVVVERSSMDSRWKGSERSRSKLDEDVAMISSGGGYKRRNIDGDDSTNGDNNTGDSLAWPYDEATARKAIQGLHLVAVSANVDTIAPSLNAEIILQDNGLQKLFDDGSAAQIIVAGIALAERKRKAARMAIPTADIQHVEKHEKKSIRVPDLETILNPANYSQGNEVWWQHSNYDWKDHAQVMHAHKAESDTRKRTVIERAFIHGHICDIIIIAVPSGSNQENFRYLIEIEIAPNQINEQISRTIPGAPIQKEYLQSMARLSNNTSNENIALEALNEVLSLTDENEVFEHTARIVLYMTGFERVMIYNFDARGEEYDGYGEVVAEAIAPPEIGKEAATSYLGMKFPAADVPRQARQLYKRTQVRSIVDIESKPIPLIVSKNHHGNAVDLSDTRLRYTSPIHLVYLKNMGVRASASSSIIIGNRLVGLIACHDTRGAHPISTSVWKWLSLIGSHTSMAITAIRANRKAQLISSIQSKNRSDNIAGTFNQIAQPAIDYLQSAFAVVIAPSHFTVPSGREDDEEEDKEKKNRPRQVVECVGQATKEEVDLCVYVLQQVAKAEGPLAEAKFHFIEDLADPNKTHRFASNFQDIGSPSSSSILQPPGSDIPNQRTINRASRSSPPPSVAASPTASIMSLDPARVQLQDSVLWGGNEIDLAAMADKLRIGGIATIVTSVFIVGFIRRTVPKNIKYGGIAAVIANNKQPIKRRKGRGEPAFSSSVAEDAINEVSNSLLPRRSFEEFNQVHGNYSPAWSFEDREIVRYLGSWLVQASVYFAVSVERDRALANESMARNFLANMSHELRTPFNGVVGMLSVLLEDETLPEESMRMLRVVNRSAECMLLLLDDILTISKLENKEFKILRVSFSIQQMLDDLCELFRQRCAERGISLEYSCEVVNEVDHPKMPMLISDGGRIRQVLVNLISNAIKFSKPNSPVTVKISLHSANGRRLIDSDIEREYLKNANSHRPLADIFQEIDQAIENNVQLSPNKSSLWLLATVKDRGIGISQAGMPKLFRRFSQVDDSKTKQYQGTGLGLAICEHLIHLLGGRIWCFSTDKNDDGSKSCFQFIIPVLADTANHSVPNTADTANEDVHMSTAQQRFVPSVDEEVIKTDQSSQPLLNQSPAANDYEMDIVSEIPKIPSPKSGTEDIVTQAAQIQKFQQAALGTGLRSTSLSIQNTERIQQSATLPPPEGMLRPTSLVPSLPDMGNMPGQIPPPAQTEMYTPFQNILQYSTAPQQQPNVYEQRQHYVGENILQHHPYSPASAFSSVSNTPQITFGPSLRPYPEQQYESSGQHMSGQAISAQYQSQAPSAPPPPPSSAVPPQTQGGGTPQSLVESPPIRISPLELAKMDEKQQLDLAMSSTLPIILCVDDIENNRAVMAVMMQHKKGYHCMLAEDGLAAVNAWKQFGTRIKAIILDWHMPIMDGIEAARQIRALPHGKDLPLILVTADIMPRNEEDMKYLFNHVVIKPVTRSKDLTHAPKVITIFSFVFYLLLACFHP